MDWVSPYASGSHIAATTCTRCSKLVDFPQDLQNGICEKCSDPRETFMSFCKSDGVSKEELYSAIDASFNAMIAAKREAFEAMISDLEYSQYLSTDRRYEDPEWS